MRRIGNDGYFNAELTNGMVVFGAFHLCNIVDLKKQMASFKGNSKTMRNRKPLSVALRGRVPEEDFAEEGPHGVLC